MLSTVSRWSDITFLSPYIFPDHQPYLNGQIASSYSGTGSRQHSCHIHNCMPSMVSRRLAVVFMLLCQKVLLQLLGERLDAFISVSMESHQLSKSAPSDTSIIVEICKLVSSIVSRQQRISIRCLRSTISARSTAVVITLLTIPTGLRELLVELQQGLERSRVT
jgi:hypothetical protein